MSFISRAKVSTAFISAAVLVFFGQTAAVAAPGVYNVGADVAYTEDDPAIAVLSDFTLTDAGQNYNGESITFDIAGTNESGESLTLTESATPVVTAGVISFKNGTIFRGDGTTAVPIGNIDGVLDGTGSDLKVNFANTFQNGNFTQGITGWTVTSSRTNLGFVNNAGQTTASTATIAGFTPPVDAIWGPGTQNYSSQNFDRAIAPNTYSYDLTGDKLNMTVNSASCDTPYCVLRGPYVVSDASVYLSPGDDVSFDWAAAAGGDAFDVYGYLVNTQTGKTIKLIDETGRANSSSGGSVVAEMGSLRNETGYFTSGSRRTDLKRFASNAWTTGSSTYDDRYFDDGTSFTAGTYKFVFIAGSYDDTGGQYLGATFSIDNVAVTTSVSAGVVTAGQVEQLARLLKYSNSTGINATRTLGFSSSLSDTAQAADATKLITVTQINTAPDLAALAGHTYTDTSAIDTFTNSTGTATATDEEGDALTWSIDGGSVSGGNNTKTGTLGTLSINRTTGAYTYTPNASAMNAESSNTTDIFTIRVTDGVGSDTTVLTITLNAVQDALPTAPVIDSLTAGDGTITVNFTAPTYGGSSAITNYLYSTYGVNYFALSPASTTSPFVISALSTNGTTPLVNGTTYTIRIKAVNGSGNSPVSNAMSATPFAVPSAPTITALEAGDGAIEITFTPPASSGTGVITNYEYSSDGQNFIAMSPATTSSPYTVTIHSLDGTSRLQNGVSYSIRIRAVTSFGSSLVSNSMSATPRSPLAATFFPNTGFSPVPQFWVAGILLTTGLILVIRRRLLK